MGDNGKLYIPDDEVPEYKALLREADLILPNQFEAEFVMISQDHAEETVADQKYLQAPFRHYDHRPQLPSGCDSSPTQNLPGATCDNYLATADS